METWKNIPAYEGTYQASTEGRVRNIKTGNILTPFRFKGGSKHLNIRLVYRGRQYNVGVHRVIATTFVPNPGIYTVVHHKDFNPNNNRPSNLVWVSNSQNIALGNGRKTYYTIRVYSKGSNLVKKYTEKLTFLEDLHVEGLSNNNTQGIWESLQKYMSSTGMGQYAISLVVLEWLRGVDYKKLIYDTHISEARAANTKKGRGKIQRWVHSLSEEELESVKGDLKNLTQRGFRAKYDKTKVHVQSAIKSLTTQP